MEREIKNCRCQSILRDQKEFLRSGIIHNSEPSLNASSFDRVFSDPMAHAPPRCEFRSRTGTMLLGYFVKNTIYKGTRLCLAKFFSQLDGFVNNCCDRDTFAKQQFKSCEPQNIFI